IVTSQMRKLITQLDGAGEQLDLVDDKVYHLSRQPVPVVQKEFFLRRPIAPVSGESQADSPCLHGVFDGFKQKFGRILMAFQAPGIAGTSVRMERCVTDDLTAIDSIESTAGIE